jgi:hypothetical protein
MRRTPLAFIGSAIGFALALATCISNLTAAGLDQPTSVKRAAYNDYLYFAPTDASNTAPAPAATEMKKEEPGTATVEEWTSEAAAEEPAVPEPRRLIGQVGSSKFNIYGWLDAGITGNADSPASDYNGPLAPNDKTTGQLNQFYLVMEKKIDTEQNCWDFGGRIDMLYGTDYIYGQSLGLETHSDGSRKWNSGIDYGLIMPQIYAEVGYGRLSLKLGHFYGIIGYESLMATSNFFYSQNYCVRYAEDTAYTGGMFTWKHSDELSIYLGGVNGQDRFDGQSDTFAVVTGFDWAPKEKKYLLHGAIQTAGTEPGVLPVQGVRTYADTYLTYNLTEKYQFVTQFDYGWQNNYNLIGDTATFYSITQYAYYVINCKWKAGLRYDYYNDEQGITLGGLRYGGQPGGNPLPLPSGNAGAVQAISAGVNWTPNANFRLRPELRWDWYNGQGLPLFDDRTKNSQFTAAVDAIIQY